MCGLLVASTLWPAQASAANFFKQPGRWVKDVGRSADKDFRRFRREVGNFVSLGEIDRQRDRERAEQARREAEQAQRFAQETRKREIASVDREIAHFQAHKKVLELTLQNLSLVRLSAENHLRLVDHLAESMESQSAEYETLVKLIQLQQQDLIHWFTDTGSERMVGADERELKQRIGLYLDQVENIPQHSSEIYSYEFLMDLFRAGHAMLDFIQQSEEDILRQIAVNEDHKRRAQQRRQRLN